MTQLVYILAASHSGSTLLSMLLASHPRIGSIGEMKLPASAMGDLRRYRCSCGSLIQECGFWQEIRESMGKRGFDFDLTCAGTDYRAIASPYARRILAASHGGQFLESIRDTALNLSAAWHRQLPEIHRRNAALASTICEIVKAKIVVDSSKNAVRLKYLLRNRELDVRVIHLIRDGRAVALTYTDPASFADAKDPRQRGGGMGGGRKSERLSMAEAASEWYSNMKEAEHILRGLGKSRRIEIRYEEYCQDPDGTLARLFVFLGLDPNEGAKDFRSVEQHVVGNGMRLDTTCEVRLDERWKQVLTQEQLRVFDRVAGKMNRKYGYR